MDVRGRSCPIGYRYRPEALAQPARLDADTVYEDAGCGCAYLDYVADDVVDRSNQIIIRRPVTAGRFPDVVRRASADPGASGRGDAASRPFIAAGGSPTEPALP